MIQLKGKPRKVIFTTDACDIYDNLRKDSEFEEASDNEIWELAYEEISNIVDDECNYNLNIDLNGDIILVGDIVRWNGAYPAHRETRTHNIGKAILDAMSAFDGDNKFTVYVQDGKVLLEQYGHDNPMSPSIVEFRVLNSNYDDFEARDWDEVSDPITPYVNKVYGWEAV